MDFDPVFLSRVQFAFVISFHIIFPAFTIGLGAWLATIEGARLITGNPIYRRVFDFWLKVFTVSVPPRERAVTENQQGKSRRSVPPRIAAR